VELRSIRLDGAKSFLSHAAKAGLRLPAAVREWSAAAAFADRVDAELPTARAMVMLAGMMVEAGEQATAADPAAAMTALSQARSLASTLPPADRWGRLHAAAIALAELGDMKAAQQALQDAITAWSKVAHLHIRPTPWCTLAGDCVRVGLYGKAVSIAQQLPTTGPWAFDRAQALVSIVDALLEQNDRDRAVAHLEEAVQQISLHEFPPQRIQNRGNLAARFAQVGMLSRAMADDLSAEAPQETRETIASHLGRRGRPEEALSLYPGPATPQTMFSRRLSRPSSAREASKRRSK
jgi:tetratricopeptide (TPR) repeat protein